MRWKVTLDWEVEVEADTETEATEKANDIWQNSTADEGLYFNAKKIRGKNAT